MKIRWQKGHTTEYEKVIGIQEDLAPRANRQRGSPCPVLPVAAQGLVLSLKLNTVVLVRAGPSKHPPNHPPLCFPYMTQEHIYYLMLTREAVVLLRAGKSSFL